MKNKKFMVLVMMALLMLVGVGVQARDRRPMHRPHYRHGHNTAVEITRTAVGGVVSLLAPQPVVVYQAPPPPVVYHYGPRRPQPVVVEKTIIYSNGRHRY